MNSNVGFQRSSPDYAIVVTNVTQGEIFCYSLPIVKGYISAYREENDGERSKTIRLRKIGNNKDSNEEDVTSWPVVNGNFKCLANLTIGKNEFELEFERCRLRLNLEFKSKKISYHVLPVYIICEGHDGRFQAPENEDNSPVSACKRIALGSRLIQSFTAEKLFESKMGKRTFQLGGDMNINLECIIFRSKLTPDEIYGMESEEIWEHFGRELMSSPYGNEKRKFLAFLSCTKYIPTEKEPETYEETVAQMQGHIALGGGGLAIFGTGCLHTWPETIDQILPRFLNDTKVDKKLFMDDSCYRSVAFFPDQSQNQRWCYRFESNCRGTYGSCFSTTLGSVCHELGHAFDLGHSKKGIMGRGFDNINLVFTIGNQTRHSNKNARARSEPQHSTVSFTRNLNITYRMSSPIKRPRGRPTLRPSSPKKSVSNDVQEKTWNMDQDRNKNYHLDERMRSTSNAKVLIDDLTFWDKSCSVLLKYHR
ncbi:hypothetical protein RUM43_005804 [Polyplax serrata]|uniref:Uncharacterized protein n=1 Tax=Polyplax serrata TaxID=468196 RepID=A0AAN8PBQ9_POLSC